MVANYNKCGGDWAMIMNYQAGGNEDDIPRYKKIIGKQIKAGKAKKFSAKQTAKIVAELDATAAEEALSDADEDDDSEEETAEDKKFINDVASESEEDDDEEEAEETDSDGDGDGDGDGEGAGDDDDDDDGDSSDDDDDEEEAGGDAELTRIRANLAKSPNVPKKQGKFKKFMMNTFKLEDEDAINALWAEQQAAKKK